MKIVFNTSFASQPLKRQHACHWDPEPTGPNPRGDDNVHGVGGGGGEAGPEWGLLGHWLLHHLLPHRAQRPCLHLHPQVLLYLVYIWLGCSWCSSWCWYWCRCWKYWCWCLGLLTLPTRPFLARQSSPHIFSTIFPLPKSEFDFCHSGGRRLNGHNQLHLWLAWLQPRPQGVQRPADVWQVNIGVSSFAISTGWNQGCWDLQGFRRHPEGIHRWSGVLLWDNSVMVDFLTTGSTLPRCPRWWAGSRPTPCSSWTGRTGCATTPFLTPGLKISAVLKHFYGKTVHCNDHGSIRGGGSRTWWCW